MLSVFTQMLILTSFALAGYILSKTGKLDSSHAKILSVLEVYVFLPCTVIKTFSRNFTVNYITNNYGLILVGLLILLSVIVFSYSFSRLLVQKGYERNVYIYSLIVPNTGYVGYAVAEALYGSKTLQDVMIFGIPMNIFIYTVGYCLLTRKKLNLKNLINPVMMSMLIGAALGLSNITLPETVGTILQNGSACMAPVSMLLAGIIISEFKIKALLKNYKNYIVIFLRLIFIPAVIALILKLIGGDKYVLYAMLAYSMPCGLNTVVFPKLIDENCETGASLALISNVLCCVTIPIIFKLFECFG